MTEPNNTIGYSRARLDDRQVTEMIGLSRGLLADGQLNDSEIDYLYKWLAASKGATSNPLIGKIFDRMTEMLSDNVIDDDERAEMISTLNELCGNDFEIGETLKSTTLPLCNPAPEVNFLGMRFSFTGTFVFGSRRECENAVKELGATTGTIAKSTDFLVIGEYATDSWQQSSFGRKIEKAVEFRTAGVPISIISEQHWKRYLTL